MSKQIIITGACGFVGSHVLCWMLEHTDFNFTVIDRLTYAGSLHRLTDDNIWSKEGKRVKFVYHDFRSPFPDNVFAKVSNPHPDYILHLGAESHVDNSMIFPQLFIESNIIGTLNLLEFARKVKPEKFFYFSTDEVYGAVVGEELHKEGEPHRPSNPYSASKAGAEDIAWAYWITHKVPVIFTNTMNVIGERQDKEKFVPKTISAILNNKPVILHCKKNSEGDVVDMSSRCWIHARTVAAALLFLMENGVIGERYNIVGERLAVDNVAMKIANTLGLWGKWLYEDFHSFRPGHDLHYGLDGSKMVSMGWVPPLSLDESLAKTVRWTVEHPEWL